MTLADSVDLGMVLVVYAAILGLIFAEVSAALQRPLLPELDRTEAPNSEAPTSLLGHLAAVLWSPGTRRGYESPSGGRTTTQGQRGESAHTDPSHRDTMAQVRPVVTDSAPASHISASCHWRLWGFSAGITFAVERQRRRQ